MDQTHIRKVFIRPEEETKDEARVFSGLELYFTDDTGQLVVSICSNFRLLTGKPNEGKFISFWLACVGYILQFNAVNISRLSFFFFSIDEIAAGRTHECEERIETDFEWSVSEGMIFSYKGAQWKVKHLRSNDIECAVIKVLRQSESTATIGHTEIFSISENYLRWLHCFHEQIYNTAPLVPRTSARLRARTRRTYNN